MDSTTHTTDLLVRLCDGNAGAAEALAPQIYDELHALADRFMGRERGNHTLQPTALVHEAYMRLIDQSRADWKNRAQFMAVAAEVMRRLLVDYARRRQTVKHGGDAQRILLTDSIPVDAGGALDLLALDEALDELAGLNDRHRRVIELRFFGGLSVDDTAHALGLAPQTVRADWYAARAWLRVKLADS